MGEEVLLALSTFPDIETARRIARQLVTENFAACANIIPAIESIYRWKGKVESGDEVLVIFKVAAGCYSEFETKLRGLHPYEVPEIVACKIDHGLPEYLSWVAETCAR